MSKKVILKKSAMMLSRTDDFADTIRDNFSSAQWADLAKRTVKEKILTKLDKGLSPVAKQRKLQRYSESYVSAMRRSASELKRLGKVPRPPNLRLTGELHSHYDARPVENRTSITLGIHEDAPAFVKLKAKAHNEGTEKIPARRLVPLKDEQYTRDIMLELRQFLALCLYQAINRRKNR